MSRQKGKMTAQRDGFQMPDIAIQAQTGADTLFTVIFSRDPEAIVKVFLADGRGRTAAHAADDSGDALLQQVGAVGHCLDALVQMAVGVDKAGSQHLSGPVDGFFA